MQFCRLLASYVEIDIICYIQYVGDKLHSSCRQQRYHESFTPQGSEVEDPDWQQSEPV